MKKIISILTALMLLLAACGGEETSKTNTDKDKDVASSDYYFAVGEVAKNGWTTYVVFNYDDGDITNFVYDAVNLKTGVKDTKIAMSEAGKYNLADGAVAPYNEQAETIMEYVNENDGLDNVTFDEDGKSDAISGATISYDEISTLIDEAIANGPVEGATDSFGEVFFGQAEVADNGWQDQVAYFVYNDVIVAAHVDGAKDKDGKTIYKSNEAADGNYVLAEGSTAPLLDQFEIINADILEQQFAFAENTAANEDAISGATISVSTYVTAFDNAQ